MINILRFGRVNYEYSLASCDMIDRTSYSYAMDESDTVLTTDENAS